MCWSSRGTCHHSRQWHRHDEAHGVSPDTFSWPVAILCALFACFMRVSANLINDMVDFKRGLDKSKLYYFTKQIPPKGLVDKWLTKTKKS